jgi:peroxiredoxin
MKMMLTAMIVIFALAMVVGCDSNESNQADSPGTPPAKSDQRDAQPQPVAPTDAGKVQPLGVGEKASAAILRRPDGQETDLATLYGQKPTVLIFYRGGWCPYCNTHLGQIATAEPELLKMGYQVVAISPDRPEELAKTLDKQHLAYQLLSDSDAVLARAFGLVFRVDDPTLEKYRGFGIDLEGASGRDHHLLPVPAVYIVDTTGTIRFAHWNPDYKTRLASEDLLKAAREVQPAPRTALERGD